MYETKIARLDFGQISNQPGRDFKIAAIQKEIQRIGGIHNVLVTDCLSYRDQDGLLVMMALQQHNNANLDLHYKIRCLKDKWGKHVHPGDFVEWKFARKTRDMFGKKITNRQFKEAVRRGQQREFEEWHNAVVDEKGCITVPFKDAAILLDTRGVHFESMQPLTSMPQFEREVTRDHYDKDFAKVVGRQHYWLYCEIPRDTYQDLPTIKQKKDKGEKNHDINKNR